MSSLMVELSGEEEKLDAFVELVRPYGIRELARTGVIAMSRGGSTSALTEDDARTDQRQATGRSAARPSVSDKRQPTQEEIEATPPG